MKELYELKEKLCKELEEYGHKDMSAGSLDVIDKLAHSIKNIDKIIECYEDEEYSGSYRRSNDGDYAMDYDKRSYARRRGGRRSYDGMRGYSYHGKMVDELKDLMEDAPDEKTRQEFHKFIQKLEMM